MSPLLVVIVTFGLIFVFTASLGQGFAMAPGSLRGALGTHRQLDVMLVISNFVVMPALLIGLASLIDFNPQVKMAIVVLAITAGAPFIPWLVAQGKGDLGYSVAVSFGLTLLTLILTPLALPLLLRALDTGASPSVWHVAWPLLLFILVPILVGMLCRSRYPELVAEVGPWLGPLSITFLVVHVCLYIGYSWSEFLSLAGYGQLAFALVFPFAGLLIGYLLSPPYVLSPVPAAHPQRGTKIVSSVSVAQQNTGAVICCAIFPLGPYLVAGDYLLLGAILTIVVVLAFMLELGARFAKTTAPVPSRAATSALSTPATSQAAAQ
jgi:BASS family bile acid:Na+ symporter